MTGVSSEEDVLKAADEVSPLLYTESVSDLRDIFVFAEDMTSEDEEKKAIEELERMKKERQEMRRKRREEIKKKKEKLEKEIQEGMKIVHNLFASGYKSLDRGPWS